MMLSYYIGAIGPYYATLKDSIVVDSGPEFTPKKHKLKGWQKAKRK